MSKSDNSKFTPNTISPSLIRSAKDGILESVRDLAQAIDKDTYNIPALEATLVHFKQEPLFLPPPPHLRHSPRSRSHWVENFEIEYERTDIDIEYQFDLLATALTCLTRCIGCSDLLKARPSLGEQTVLLILDVYDDLVKWMVCLIWWAPVLAPDGTGVIVETISYVTRALTRLDKRLSDRVFQPSISPNKTYRVFEDVLLSIWTMRDPISQGRLFMDLEGHGNLIETMMGCFASPQATQVTTNVLLSSPSAYLKPFCEAFVERHAEVASFILANTVPYETNSRFTLSLGLNTFSQLILIGSCLLQNKTHPPPSLRLIHRTLFKQNYISRAASALASTSKRFKPSQSLLLSSQLFFACSEASGDSVACFSEAVAAGTFGTFVGSLVDTPFLGIGLGMEKIGTTKVLVDQLYAYSWHPKTLRAMYEVLYGGNGENRAWERKRGAELRAGMNKKKVELGGGGESWEKLVGDMPLRVAALKSARVLMCDNFLHQHAACPVEKRKEKPAATQKQQEQEDESRTCSVCHLVVYCSTWCQKVDWELRHRGECRVMRHTYIESQIDDRRYHHLTRAFHIKYLESLVHNLWKDAQTSPTPPLRTRAERRSMGSGNGSGKVVYVFDTTVAAAGGVGPRDSGMKSSNGHHNRNHSTANGDTPTLNPFSETPLPSYTKSRPRSKCPASEARVEELIKEVREDKEEETRLVEARFVNGRDENVVLVMVFRRDEVAGSSSNGPGEEKKYKWAVGKSVARVLKSNSPTPPIMTSELLGAVMRMRATSF